MNMHIFWATFVTILTAEFGDKTQLAAMVASAASEATFSIFAATCLALVISGGVGVFAGKLLKDWINPSHLQISAGLLFIAMGAWTLFKALR